MKMCSPFSLAEMTKIHLEVCDYFMECIDIKDVDGDEIYDGDILEAVDVSDFEEEMNLGDRFEVTYWDGKHKLQNINSIEYKDILEMTLHSDNSTEMYKIVGNVYQTPHLLPDWDTRIKKGIL